MLLTPVKAKELEPANSNPITFVPAELIKSLEAVNSSEEIISDQPVYIDPVANRFNTTDIDFVVGLTRKLYKNLLVNIRYQYSLTSFRPTERIPYGYSYGNQGQFNNLFNLRMVYVF